MVTAASDPCHSDSPLDEILAFYLEEVEAGRTPDRDAVLAKHPELIAELNAFFANLDHVAELASPWRAGHVDADTTVDPFAARSLPVEEGQRIGYFGDYELLREIGRGGMGVVYAARQVSLDRVLAVKMISEGRLAALDGLERFRREAEAVAHLDHPAIVPIFEVGDHNGRHYFSMKLVDGGSLSQLAPQLREDPKTAAKLLAEVARAVHYAHQRGILHRDLKPANILLDRQGRPFVADFGLARRVEGDGTLTRSDSIIGTPAYMAPEQAEGRREAVTTASDVYGLGAILYETLTGQPPFRGKTVFEIVQQVREIEPESPSRINPTAPRDLVTICLKCLEKDPRRRYASAEAFAEDLERWLDGRPIFARPSTFGERVIKWGMRHRVAAMLIVVSVMAVFAGAVAVQVTLLARRLRGEIQLTDQERQSQFDARRRAEAEVDRQKRENEQAKPRAYLDRIAAAERAWFANDVENAEKLLDDCPTSLRRWEWYYLKRQCHAERLMLRGHNGVTCSVAFAPDTSCFTCPDERGGVTIWDARANKKVCHLRGHDGTAYGVVFDRTGSRLATAGSDGSIRLWDVQTGELTKTLSGHAKYAAAVAFSPDGARIVSGGADKIIRVWDTTTGNAVLEIPGHSGEVFGVAISPDGTLLASAGQGGTVFLWDFRTGEEKRRFAGHEDASRALAFHPDGRRLASGGADRMVKLWDVLTGDEIRRFRAAEGRIDGLAFNPDGTRLATGSRDRSVKVWDVETGAETASYRGHLAPVFAVAFSPDGHLLASAGQDAVVKVWNATDGPGSRVLSSSNRGPLRGSVAAASLGSVVALAGAEQGLILFDATSGGEQAVRFGAVLEPHSLCIDVSGRHLAAVDQSGAARVWEIASGRERLVIQRDDETFASVALAPDGSWIVTGGGLPLAFIQLYEGKGVRPDPKDHRVRIWDASTGRQLSEFTGHRGTIHSVAVARDARWIASGGDDGIVHIWDVQSRRQVHVFDDRDRAVFSVAFSPDCRFLASAGLAGRIRIREVESGRELHVLSAESGLISKVCYSPDGTRIASAGGDGTVRIWDPASGRELLALGGHSGRVSDVTFSPDGRLLITGGADGTVRVWDASP
jgi:eukaryotic-like serine/threonine-protein kinase